MLWLQKDYNIYLANVFDTYQVCLALKKEEKSLNYLLNEYCKETKNKVMQVCFLTLFLFQVHSKENANNSQF